VRNLIRKILREDLDWTKDIKPMSMTNLYVIDVRNLSYRDEMDLLEDLRELGYEDTSQISRETADYIYMEYEDGRFFVDWADHSEEFDPTFGGDYQMIDMDMFNEMFYNWKIERDTGSLFKEDFDWTATEQDPWKNVSKEILNKIDSDVLDRIISILDWEIDYSKSDAYEHDPCKSVRFEIEEVHLDDPNEIVISYVSYCDETPTYLSLWYNPDTDEHQIA
jgi:hypothetical protein